MRILLVLGSSAGGVGRHVHGLAGGLVARGHDVVVAGPGEVDRQLDLAGTGASVVAVTIAARPNLARDAGAVRRLRDLFARADVVHAHGLRAGALCCLAAVGRSRPVVVTLHNAAPPGRATKVVYAVLERLVARRATTVVGVSADLVERMAALGAHRTGLAVVPAPARPRIGRPARQVRRELGVKPGLALGLVVARLAPQKGLDVLLEAAGRLRDLDVLLVVAGDGPLAEPLQGLIDREGLPVRLLGRRADVPDLLAAADLVVSSARWEGQPLALQEALALGAAIVATEVGGTAATLGGAALLVPGNDAAALADGIRALVADPDERARLSALALARAATLPTDEDAVDAVLSTYRDAATI